MPSAWSLPSKAVKSEAQDQQEAEESEDGEDLVTWGEEVEARKILAGVPLVVSVLPDEIRQDLSRREVPMAATWQGRPAVWDTTISGSPEAVAHAMGEWVMPADRVLVGVREKWTAEVQETALPRSERPELGPAHVCRADTQGYWGGCVSVVKPVH